MSDAAVVRHRFQSIYERVLYKDGKIFRNQVFTKFQLPRVKRNFYDVRRHFTTVYVSGDKQAFVKQSNTFYLDGYLALGWAAVLARNAGHVITNPQTIGEIQATTRAIE